MDPKLKALIDEQGTEWVVNSLVRRAMGAEKERSFVLLEQVTGRRFDSQKAAIDWWRTHKQQFSGRLPKPDVPSQEFESLVQAAARAADSAAKAKSVHPRPVAKPEPPAPPPPSPPVLAAATKKAVSSEEPKPTNTKKGKIECRQFGALTMLAALFMGGKRKKVWKCAQCGYIFERA